MSATVAAIVEGAEARLAAAGVASPHVDAWRLAVIAAGCDRAQLASHWRDDPPWPQFAASLAPLVERREAREPLQHIEGIAAFLDFDVAVGPGVLVPRPETEVTATVALGLAPSSGRFLDAGTGSGVIAIALARERPDAEVHATERSMSALVWSARNFAALAPRVVLHEQWYLGLPGDFDLVVANPPYVDCAELAHLEPEVRDHDPEVALVPAGGDGLADVALLVREVSARVRPGGAFVCEIGAGQGAAAAAVADPSWGHVEVVADLVGRDRVLVCTDARR